MDSPIISSNILLQLQQRATESGLSLDELLTRFLDTSPDYQHNLESLIENFDGSIWSIDRQYRLLVGNKVYHHTISTASAGREIRSGDSTLPINLPQNIIDEWRSYYDRALAGEKFTIELATRYQDIPREIEYRFNPIHAADGSIFGATIFARDMTEYRKAERALLQSEGRFKLAAHLARLGIWDWEIATDKTTWYGEMFNIYGISPDEFTGRGLDYIDFTRADYRLPQEGNILKAFENGITESDIVAGKAINLSPKELCIVRPDGTEAFTQGDAIAIVDAEGKPLRMLGVTVDITQQRLAEEAVRQSEARLQSIIQSQTTYIVRTDLNGNYSYVHESFFRKFCWQYECIEDVIGKSGMMTILPEDHQVTIDTVNACLQQIGTAVQVVLRKPAPNDAFYWTIWEFVALADATGQATEIQCMGIDITELMQARQQLQVQEAALQAAATSIMIADREGMITWVNPAFTKLTGYSVDEAIGNSVNLLKSGLHDEEFYHELWETILAGQVWQGQFVTKRKDGSLYDEEQIITPVRDENGKISHFVAIMQDITIRKQAETLRLEQERLKASLKKEQEFNILVQKAVSALAHDVRTPLTVISNAKQTLDRYFDRLDESQRREKLDSIGKQLHYLVELLNEMSLTVKGSLDERIFQVKPINLPSLCQISINEIHETVGSRHKMRLITDGSIDLVSVDETLVSRILLNLLSNAVKFSPEANEIRLELKRNENWISIAVIDKGLGISTEDLPHIFEPFYRADNVNHIRGTGLGLNIVKDCVERHHGNIEVISQVGKGTRFIVELPFMNS